MENKEQVVYTKEDLIWHYASMYLEGLMHTGARYDEEFMRLYNRLRDYVDSKLYSPCGGDIVEISVFVGRKINK